MCAAECEKQWRVQHPVNDKGGGFEVLGPNLWQAERLKLRLSEWVNGFFFVRVHTSTNTPQPAGAALKRNDRGCFLCVTNITELLQCDTMTVVGLHGNIFGLCPGNKKRIKDDSSRGLCSTQTPFKSKQKNYFSLHQVYLVTWYQAESSSKTFATKAHIDLSRTPLKARSLHWREVRENWESSFFLVGPPAGEVTARPTLFKPPLCPVKIWQLSGGRRRTNRLLVHFTLLPPVLYL